MTELTLNEVALLKEHMGFVALETRLHEIEAENKALKAANKALRARIEALEPKPAAPVKPIEPIVKVTNPIAAATLMSAKRIGGRNSIWRFSLLVT
jgi:hypothetical protein